jgi:competence protein ComEC
MSVTNAADWEIFRLTGIAHLVSISGLHVTMFAWLASALLGRSWRLLAWAWPGLLLRWPAQPVAAVGGVLLSLAYAVFAGWGVPAQRTLLMLGLLTALRLAGLRWPWPVLLLAAMVAVLLLDPWALLQVGFWLSFVAVGVLLSSSWLGQDEPGGARAWFIGLLRTQLIVSVALAPLTLLSFGQFSVVGLLANLAAVPWVTVIVTPLAMLGVFWSPLWRLGAWCVELMTAGLESLAGLPWAAIERPELPAALALATLLGGVLLVLRLPWSTRGWGLLLAWPLMAWTPARPAPGEFELLAPDVGQGSAIVVRTARHTLVHDSGPGQGRASAAQRVLLPLLRAGGDRLDLLVASHDDLDHAGGLPELLRRHPRAELWASYDTRRATGRPARFCAAGQRWSWDGVAFEWLSPRADAVAGQSDNALSCVLRVTSASGRVALLTGDIGLREEARLLGEYPGLRADLLLAGHHGSASSSGAAWLDGLRPALVLIQAGHLNRFGHPAPELLQRLHERDISWHASPQCGAASWRSANPAQVECWRQLHRRYWQAQAGSSRP